MLAPRQAFITASLTALKDPHLLRDAGINDRARKVKMSGPHALVPLKFDKAGIPIDEEDPDFRQKVIFKRLSLIDLKFLVLWRQSRYSEDLESLSEKSKLPYDTIERLIKKLTCFREEEAKVKALCEIPTPEWISAKHVENVYDPTLDESQHKSLAELAKIEGAYKQQAPQNQLNVFNIGLTPEQEAQLKPVFDTIALEGNSDVAA